MQKTIFTYLSLLLLIVSTQSYAMKKQEQELSCQSRTKLSKDFYRKVEEIYDSNHEGDSKPIELPIELISKIMQYVYPNSYTVNKYSQLIQVNTSYHTKILPNTSSDYEPGTTLNPLMFVEQENKLTLFHHQCWSEQDRQNYNTIRFDDDITGERYIRKINFNPHSYYFDGLSDERIFIVGLNNNNNNYQYNIAKIAETTTVKRSLPAYKHITSDRAFEYTSELQEGTLTTLALHKETNRFALVDNNNNIKIFDITESNDNNTLRLLPKQKNDIALNLTAGNIKKICFVTERTLLCLTDTGGVFSIVLAKNAEPKIFQQKFKDSNQQELKITQLGVNPLYPSRIALCTSKEQLLYLDLNYKKLIILKNKLPHEVQDLWFYEDRIGVLAPQLLYGNKFSLYTVRENIVSIKDVVASLSTKQNNNDQLPLPQIKSNKLPLKPFFTTDKEKFIYIFGKSNRSFIKKYLSSKIVDKIGSKCSFTERWLLYPIITGYGIDIGVRAGKAITKEIADKYNISNRLRLYLHRTNTLIGLLSSTYFTISLLQFFRP